MSFAWLVILPPLIVVVTALVTRRMIVSFLLGIGAACLIATKGNLVSSFLLAISRLWQNTGLAKIGSKAEILNNWNLLIFIFLLCLGILIVLLQQTGAASAYARIAQRLVTNRTRAQSASLILSFLFFIDDYFSALTVGSVMRPLAALYQIHPVKLAYLTTAMAIPLTIISPVSSWVGEIILQLKQTGIGPAGSIINGDPYFVFIKTIPFIFYAWFMIFAAWYVVLRGISFGPMKKYDNSSISSTPVKTMNITSNASIIDFLFPILFLIVVIMSGLLYTGGYYLFGGPHGFMKAIEHTAPHQALGFGGLLSVIVSISYFLVRKKITMTSLYVCIKDGILLMLPSIIMLIHAWTLGSLLKNDLHTGDYIAHLLGSMIWQSILPVVSFISCAITSWMLGSSWATMGLVFPIIIPMTQTIAQLPSGSSLDQALFLLPIIGAILSGCVMGNQISLIADNPLMSCASTGANHLEHVKTMAWYAMPVGIATLIAYVILGNTFCWGIGHCYASAFIGGLVTLIGLFEFAQRFI